MKMSNGDRFKVWDKQNKRWLNTEDYYLKADGILYEYDRYDTCFDKWNHVELVRCTGLKDDNDRGNLIYDGDIVYLAGYGDYEVEWPYLELFEALNEKDVGKIKGNKYEGITEGKE